MAKTTRKDAPVDSLHDLLKQSDAIADGPEDDRAAVVARAFHAWRKKADERMRVIEEAMKARARMHQ